MCSSATFIVAFMTIIWFPKNALSCLDDNGKKLLEQHKVKIDVISKVKGKLYLEMWATKEYTDVLDCTTSKYSADKDGLSIDFRNVLKDEGTHTHFTETWTKSGGEGKFECKGEIKTAGYEPTDYKETVYVFYSDDHVIGYIGCGIYDNADYLKTTIAVVKDRISDKKALESLAKAEAIMNTLKSIIPNEMVKFTQLQCPTEI